MPMHDTRLSIPLHIASPIPLGTRVQPVTVGVPLPKEMLREDQPLCLVDDSGRSLAVQTEVTARWTDGSVRWLLVDFLLDNMFSGTSARLCLKAFHEPSADRPETEPRIEVRQSADRLLVDTGAMTAEIDRRVLRPLTSPAMRTELRTNRGKPVEPRIDALTLQTRGPVRTTVLAEGVFPRCRGLRFRCRLCFFAGTGLMRMRLTVHNPNRARHPGGLWDLGDRGSFFFEDLSVELDGGRETGQTLWNIAPDEPPRTYAQGRIGIYQDSSGGENWQGRNHVDRFGRIPCRKRGYVVEGNETEITTGLRAEPTVALQTENGTITAAVPEFWQQFPKLLESDGRRLHVGLFPDRHDGPFELQGGEQKTHTVWFSFGDHEEPSEPTMKLDWVHRPARVVSTPAWYAASGVFGHLLPATEDPDERLGTLMEGAIRGEDSFFARREVIDEYGWRHWGDVYADHENAHYTGEPPVISHYNNQFDVVLGAILQQMRTGDVTWTELFDPLARHVTDIDIYHTDQDRAAYNGGLFWLTDHYLSAETATHRTYSQKNRPNPKAPYGGGPGSEHNYATGLLYYYYLTGDLEARAAVLSLADWVIAMDDGTQTVFGLIDDGFTGVASATDSTDYHGPGRGSANSINTLLDGHLASGSRVYLDKAEALVRRSIHPADDIDARGLLEVEARWSYTMHLTALARYLELKIERDELDFMYAYGRASLLHYARWMAEHERPYFDFPEQLEYPTEAWAAQEFRKANVLRLAARHADRPLRERLLDRGRELADRAWSDLLRFDSRGVARSVAVLMIEGLRDQYYRAKSDNPAPAPPSDHDFGRPEVFVPQRRRAMAHIKTPGGLLRTLLRTAGPRNWARIMARIRDK